jgi:alpha-mannosidase
MFMVAQLSYGLPAYFADGYHGGYYGHYPKWQAKFMVDKLIENPQWKINLEIEPETWDYVSVEDAENFRRLQDYYSETGKFGRIEFVNPAYAQPYCYNISGESIIRQFQAGMAKTLEYFPDATFTTYSCEEPCFTSALPQILTSLGYKYAVIRNPNTCWGGYTSAFGKELVRWNSSDGSSILSVPRYACEALVKDSTWQTMSWQNSPSFLEACRADGIEYPVGMCFQDAGWRNGPWLEKNPSNSEYVTWTGYIEAIAPKVGAVDWNFTIEDVKPGLVWGAQVLQNIAREVRESENKLVMAEKMAVLALLFDNASYPEKQLAEAWRNLMLSQHHDCWIVPYNNNHGQSWAKNVTMWTHRANEAAEAIIAGSAESKQAEESSGFSVKVFNPLGHRREGIVRIALPEGTKATLCRVLDSAGNEIASQAAGSELLFEANCPAMGYSIYSLSSEPARETEQSDFAADDSVFIETAMYSAEFCPEKGGAITSLKAAGSNELIKEGSALNELAGYFYDRERFISSCDAAAKVSVVEHGSLLTRVMIEGNLAENPFTQVVTFYENSPLIDFELTIDWKGSPKIGAYSQDKRYEAKEYAKAFYNDKYKLQVRFPFRNIGQRIFKNAPFDVCGSELKNTYYDSWDSIKHNVILNWVDVADSGCKAGAALFTDHTTSYINNGTELPLGLTVQYAGRALWGFNYGVDGPTHIRYALLPHEGRWDDFGVQRQSAEWNEPLFAFVEKGKPVSIGRSLLEIETDGVELSSLTAVDGAVFVRLYNAEAEENKAALRLGLCPEKIELVELNGKTAGAVKREAVSENLVRIEFDLPRYAFKTLRLSGMLQD